MTLEINAEETQDWQHQSCHNTFATCRGRVPKNDKEEDKSEVKDKDKVVSKRIHVRGLSPAGEPESSEEEEIVHDRAGGSEFRTTRQSVRVRARSQTLPLVPQGNLIPVWKRGVQTIWRRRSGWAGARSWRPRKGSSSTTKIATAGGSAQIQAQDPVRMTQLQKERMNYFNSKARLHLLLLYLRKELRIY